MALPTHILIHTNSFTERGDSTTAIELANLFITRLGIRVSVAVPRGDLTTSEMKIRELTNLGASLHRYTDRDDLESYVRDHYVDTVYTFSGGRRVDLYYFDKRNPESWRLSSAKHLTHAVFRNYDPHGDYYLYVSRWLWKSSLRRFRLRRLLMLLQRRRSRNKTAIGYLPHFTSIHERQIAEVPFLKNLPAGSKVITRVGGKDQFSDVAAKNAVRKLLSRREDLWFVMVNTEKFIEHPRVVHIQELGSLQIANLYRNSHVALNGRRMGESFGYSIIEPLVLGTPVIAPHWSRNPFMDKNHIEILSGSGLLYTSTSNLVKKIEQIVDKPRDIGSLLDAVQDYKVAEAEKQYALILEELMAQ